MDIHPKLRDGYKKSEMTYFILFVLAVSFVLLFPYAVIWSINTLFGLVIPYTWQTWLASFVLTSVVSGSIHRLK